MYIAYQKRKKAEIKGLKSALTSICFFSLAIFNLFAYWFQFGGMLTVLFSIVLLLVGAYFTKYIPISKKGTLKFIVNTLFHYEKRLFY
ncbi:hypothetical protein ACT7DD_27225 [Bacillus paranthracis]